MLLVKNKIRKEVMIIKKSLEELNFEYNYLNILQNTYTKEKERDNLSQSEYDFLINIIVNRRFTLKNQINSINDENKKELSIK